MQKPIKIPAFTLTEMLLVLAISTVVAGLAFSIISLFGRNIQAIQNNYSATTEVRLFEEQLTIDFNRYNLVKVNAESQELIFKTPMDSVRYTWDAEMMKRGEDTLGIEPGSVRFFLLGKEVRQGTIDALKIEWEEGRSPLFFYRKNDAFHYLAAHGN